MYKKIKELYSELDHAISVQEKVQVLSKLAFFHLNTEPSRCADVLEEMKRISEEANYDEGLASAYNGYARVHFRQMDFDRARVYYMMALDMLEHTDDVVLRAKVRDGLGMTFSALGNLDKAERWLLSAIDDYQVANEPTGLAANCMSNLGNLWIRRGDLDMAELWYRKGLTELEAKNNLENGTSIRVNLGILFNMRGDHQAAMDIIQQSMLEFQSRSHRLGIAACNLYLGKTYLHLKNYAEVMTHVKKALVTFKDMGHREFIADSMTTLGETYLALGGVDDALLRLLQAHQIYADMKHMDNLIQTKLHLASAYVMQGNKDQAQKYLEESMALAQEHQFSRHEQEALKRIKELDETVDVK